MIVTLYICVRFFALIQPLRICPSAPPQNCYADTHLQPSCFLFFLLSSCSHHHSIPSHPHTATAGLEFIYSQRGRPLLVVDNYLFRKNRGSYWRCIRCTKNKCKCRLILRAGREPQIVEMHSHGPETEKITFGRKVKTTMSSKVFGALIGSDAAAAVSLDDTTLVTEQLSDSFKCTDDPPAGPVQLWVRQPHFNTDTFVLNEIIIEGDAAEEEEDDDDAM